MSPPYYTLAGNLVRFSFGFMDVNGNPADPTTVTVTIGTSMADAVTLAPVRDALGQWHADWDTTDALQATYYCLATGTGALEVAQEVPIKIRVPHV